MFIKRVCLDNLISLLRIVIIKPDPTRAHLDHFNSGGYILYRHSTLALQDKCSPYIVFANCILYSYC